MVYTNLEASNAGLHGMFESSRLESTDVGRLHDVLVRDESGATPVAIDVDNGVPVKVGEFTGNGLQERYATIAGVKDEIAVIGSPALVKEAYTEGQGQPYNFYNKAGFDAKAYSVKDEYEDIFAVANYQFTNVDQSGNPDMTAIVRGAYVVTNGAGKWTAQATAPTAANYGFIGKIHSISVGTYYTMVRIACIQNTQQASS